jgi:F0F1-type ATP synthase assembly protein I
MSEKAPEEKDTQKASEPEYGVVDLEARKEAQDAFEKKVAQESQGEQLDKFRSLTEKAQQNIAQNSSHNTARGDKQNKLIHPVTGKPMSHSFLLAFRAAGMITLLQGILGLFFVWKLDEFAALVKNNLKMYTESTGQSLNDETVQSLEHISTGTQLAAAVLLVLIFWFFTHKFFNAKRWARIVLTIISVFCIYAGVGAAFSLFTPGDTIDGVKASTMLILNILTVLQAIPALLFIRHSWSPETNEYFQSHEAF